MMPYIIAGTILSITTIILIKNEIAFNKKMIYFFKPLSTCIVIITLFLSFLPGGHYVQAYTLALFGGIFFSLCGDVSLMFPENPKAFRAGLGLFLVAHIIYGVVFTVFSPFTKNDFLSTGVILLVGVALYLYLYSGLGDMKIPVLLYVIIICFMLSRAVATFWGGYFSTTQAICISGGAGLFFISDIMLAINRFKIEFHYNRVSLAFYYSGQFLIIFSAGIFQSQKIKNKDQLMIGTKEIKIRGYHLDMFSHVNNARYLEFLEEARWSHFEDLNLTLKNFAEAGISIVVVNINIAYKYPATFGDKLVIKTHFKEFRNTSGDIEQKITLNDTDTPVIDAIITFVIIDLKTGKPTGIPDDFKEKFKKL